MEPESCSGIYSGLVETDQDSGTMNMGFLIGSSNFRRNLSYAIILTCHLGPEKGFSARLCRAFQC